MQNNFIEDVYETMIGVRKKEYCVPGISNEYEPGNPCTLLYQEVYEANRRLCQRLGISADDHDVETIVSNMFDIQKLLCMKMYEYGAKFGTPD